MTRKSILCLTYWYPNKSNKSFGIFVKRHAHAIHLFNNVTVLSFIVRDGSKLFSKKTRIYRDEKNVETHEIVIESRFRKIMYLALPVHYIIIRRYIAKNLTEIHFQVLHSNVIFPCGIIGYFLSKHLNIPHVISEHWTKIDKFFARSLYRIVAKQALKEAKAITCVSNQLKQTMSRYVANTGKISVVPNVVDDSEFYYDCSISKYQKFSFISVANWSQYKNPFYFLDSLEELHQEKNLQDFQVIMVGEGEKLEKILQKEYSFDIKLKGLLEPAQLLLEYNKCHAFVHGSEFETFSVVIAEALMCGLPCVVSPVGIAPDVINSNNGFVTNNTLTDWKSKLLLLSRRQYNAEVISGDIQDRYSISAVGKEFARIYECQ